MTGEQRDSTVVPLLSILPSLADDRRRDPTAYVGR